MGSLIQPNQINTTGISTSNKYDDLLTEIVKGNVVLVLGHEGILNDTMNRGGNVKEVMYEHFISYKHSYDENFKCSYKNFDDYFYHLRPDLTEFKDEVVESLNAFNFDSEDDYSPLLFQLLNRKYFRLVLTTTYDYYIEAMLTKVWGKKPRVINIYDAKNDINNSEIGKLEMEPTLYYIFGKAEEKKDYVLIENDAIKVTEKWFCDKPENLLKFLSNKTILALGTKFDDWLFRFFWFILHRDIRALKRGKVAISLNPKDSESDKKLCNFLDNEKINHRSIEQAINEILNSYPKAEEKYLKEHGRQGNEIFISYHSEDFEAVKHAFYSLDDYIISEKLRTHIWFDRNPDLSHGLKPGDEYRKIIKNAIETCKVFIPVITKNVKKILEGNDVDTHFFIDEEWQSALARKNLKDQKNPIFIIPLCLDGLEVTNIHPNKLYKQVFDQIKSDSVGTNKTQIEYDTFLATIKSKFE